MSAAAQFPWVFVLIDALGMAMFAAGVFGAIGAPTGALAVLSQPLLAWGMIVLGSVMGVAATLGIVLHLRAAAGRSG